MLDELPPASDDAIPGPPQPAEIARSSAASAARACLEVILAPFTFRCRTDKSVEIAWLGGVGTARRNGRKRKREPARALSSSVPHTRRLVPVLRHVLDVPAAVDVR